MSLGTLGCALGLVGFACFIGVRPCVRAGPLGSLGYALELLGFIWVAGFIGVRLRCRQVYLGSLSSLVCSLGVVVFTWVSGCIGVRPNDLVFIQCRYVHSVAA